MAAIVIAVPLLAAAVLLAVSQILPRRIADLAGLSVSAAVLALCAALVRQTADTPNVYWFGGWRPRGGVAVGIAFYVDPLGASLAGLAAALCLAAFLFAWRYFDSLGSLFHVLLLVFLGAMAGFCFSGDIFTLFVFFELMSAAAFALTGYKIEASALEGALNFAITNSIAAFFVLWGIGLIYGRTGALNLAQLGEALAGAAPDALVRMAFVLITTGFFIKGAIVPFHCWLADAHAVAPTPVCVLFSGVMVEMGLYAAARVYWTVFSGVLARQQTAISLTWTVAGAATALVGALGCLNQRHLKRLLALSTVSHAGIALMGVGQFRETALAGAAVYIAGHALVKGALFFCAGIVLHRFADVDLIALRGKGRGLRSTATIVIVAALGLAGAPAFGTLTGKSMMDQAAAAGGTRWTAVVGLFASALTAAAVLRAAGCIFFGWGPPSEDERAAPTERESRETKGSPRRVPWSMLAPPATMVLLALLLGLAPGLQEWAQAQAAGFQDRSAYAEAVLSTATHRESAGHSARRSTHADGRKALAVGLRSSLGAVALAATALFRRRLPQGVQAAAKGVLTPIARWLELLHSGRANDYVAWIVAGFGLLTLAAVFS